MLAAHGIDLTHPQHPAECIHHLNFQRSGFFQVYFDVQHVVEGVGVSIDRRSGQQILRGRGSLLRHQRVWENNSDEPTWVFITPDGRFDGSPAGLKQLYTVDEQNWKSQDVQLVNNPKYIPGLLGKLKLF